MKREVWFDGYIKDIDLYYYVNKSSIDNIYLVVDSFCCI